MEPLHALGGIPTSLRTELLAEFDKMVSNYRQRRWEPSALNGAKFCEVTYTIIKGYDGGQYPSSASKPSNFIDACRRLEQANPQTTPHSFRILIPRLLPSLYDIRSNRGVGHVGGDVDPNRMDSTLVVQAASWILAELVRVYHSVTTDEAQVAVDRLVERVVPVIWELPDGRIRVLDRSLSMRERMLVVLYYRYPDALHETDLVKAVEHSNASVFRRDILRPAHKKALVDYDETARVIHLSLLGVREVEEQIDLQF